MDKACGYSQVKACGYFCEKAVKDICRRQCDYSPVFMSFTGGIPLLVRGEGPALDDIRG